MSERAKLKAASRVNVGRIAIKKTRKEGLVPAVLYGAGKSEPLQINRIELANMLNSSTTENIIVDLEMDGGKNRMALLQEIQRDHIKDTVTHVDFHEISEAEKLYVEVPVIEVGEAVGVKTGGGVLDHVLRTLSVECLPKDLPTQIAVDVSGLDIDQSIHVGDITLPEGVTVTNNKELAVFIVHAPKTEEEVAPEATDQPQSPEVLKEKKDEGAAAEGDKGAEAKDKDKKK